MTLVGSHLFICYESILPHPNRINMKYFCKRYNKKQLVLLQRILCLMMWLHLTRTESITLNNRHDI